MARTKVADLFKVDGSVERLPSTVAKMELRQAQQLVGGLIEHLNHPVVKGVEMWCNEEGWILNLPINKSVTEIMGFPVAGDVIIERFVQA